MIQFAFDLLPFQGNISPFEMGHMDLKNNNILITSRGKKPDQLMMLFVSMVDLLDTVSKVMSSKSSSKAVFASTDSSFELLFIKGKDNVSVSDRERTININSLGLTSALYVSASEFYKKYAFKLENECSYFDLRDSLLKFKAVL